jgi:hypothetical protein
MTPGRKISMRTWAVFVPTIALAGCGAETGLRMTSGSDWHSFVRDRGGGAASAQLDAIRFRPGLCDPEELPQDYARLDETSLVRFLERQHIDARIDRPRADLLYLNVGGAGTEKPIRLRVAILANADEAGRELHQGILQHGPGSWGVRRSNLAVLGPIGSPTDDIAFAGITKLACWGVFTIAGTDDTFVLPGGYTEL